MYIKHEVSGQRKIGDRGIGRNVPWAYCLWNLHGVEGLRCAAPALGIMNSDPSLLMILSAVPVDSSLGLKRMFQPRIGSAGEEPCGKKSFSGGGS